MHLIEQIDSRIAGKDASAKRCFAVQDAATQTYVRNPECWADVDLSCVGLWNSHHGEYFTGAAISPRHVVQVHHAHFGIGAVLRFLTSDGQVVSRTCVDQRSPVGISDICISLLDEDLPPTIRPARLLPENFASLIGNPAPGSSAMPRIPVFGVKQSFADSERKCVVADLTEAGFTWSLQQPTDSVRIAFYENIQVGASGCPVFVLINGEAILAMCYSSGGYGAGSSLHRFLSEINAAMASLGGGYQAVIAGGRFLN